MNTVRFHNLSDRLLTSFWFLPLILSVVGFAAALLLIAVDMRLLNGLVLPADLRFFDTGAFRGLASFVATTTLALLGVQLSVVLVPLSIAAGQLGYTVMRTFFRSLGTQVVLGLYVGGILFSLTLLAAVPESQPAPPLLSSAVLLLLFVAIIGALLYFINEVARSLQATTVITRLSAELEGDIAREMPGPRADEPDYEALETLRQRLIKTGQSISASREGYIRAIDYYGLTQAATRHDLIMASHLEPGDFVMRGDPLAYLPAEAPLDEALTKQVRRQFLLGNTRTLTQDIDFGLLALVSVAVRALSAAINDPFTVLLCIQRLTVALAMIAERSENTRHYRDESGAVRLLAEPDRFDEHADLIFHPIRQYGRGSTEVLIGVLRMIAVVGAHTRTEAQRHVLRLHADLIDREAQHSTLMEYDITRVRLQYDQTIAALEQIARDKAS